MKEGNGRKWQSTKQGGASEAASKRACFVMPFMNTRVEKDSKRSVCRVIDDVFTYWRSVRVNRNVASILIHANG